MRRRLAVVLVCLSAGISALLGGSVAHAAGPPSKAHHGVTSVSFGTSVGSDCKLWETRENSKVPYGTGHLNVYLTFYHCVDIFGLRWEQYELYVDTSDGDLIWDVSYQDNLAVRVWLVGTYQGTTYGPQQNGELTYASDTTQRYPAGPGKLIWPYPQADDLNSYVTDTHGVDHFLPYLNF